jgi:glycine/D-amino acid oxidase-like deaminating enzyme/nitrite reductase/ring-hydroxylating ferredoxin subunit
MAEEKSFVPVEHPAESASENPAESTTISVWKRTAACSKVDRLYLTDFPPLSDTVETDIAIVGAGITGVTTGLLLQQAGYDVVIVDAHPVGYGVSGFNSGHLTSLMLDSKLRQIIADFGEEATRAVTQGICDAINLVERLVQDFRIECDFQRVPGYLFAEQSSQLHALREEYEAATRAGLPVNRTFNVPLPFNVEEAIMVPEQARFHPLKYVQALALAFHKNGGRVFENSRVSQLVPPANGQDFQVMTQGGQVIAKDVVLATHTPIGVRPLTQARLEPMRSYIIGVRSSDPLGDALYWDMEEPYHYLRLTHDDAGPLILIGGEDHKPGDRKDPAQCFLRLENYAVERFTVKSVDYRWSAQFYDPADGLPYIGKFSGVYIATGYSGEGLTFGTLAARLITDQICGIHHPCTEILQPGRAKPLASVGGILSENIHSVAHFVKDRLRKPDIDSPAHVPLGEGAICRYNNKKVAVYHSPEGALHILSPVCTHMNCIVGWNSVEKSWDCPCHGGRFDAIGRVLNGPPVHDLEPLESQASAPEELSKRD